MSNALVISVVQTGETDYRALLWKGFPVGCVNGSVFTSSVSHPNFFRHLLDLRQTVIGWQRDSSIEKVHGIDNGLPCWPLDTSIPFEEGLAVTESVNLLKSGLRLLSIPNMIEGQPAGRLVSFFSMASQPEIEFAPDQTWGAGTFGSNVFNVAERVKESFLAVARHKKAGHLAGIDDDEPFWPDGL